MQIGDVICEPKEFLLKQVLIARVRDGAAIMPANRSPRAVALLGAVEKSREVPVKVYTTEVQCDGKHYILSTGSKDIHLELGRMGHDTRQALVDLIDYETGIGPELLLVFKHRDDSSAGLICTKRTMTEELVRITLQAANS